MQRIFLKPLYDFAMLLVLIATMIGCSGAPAPPDKRLTEPNYRYLPSGDLSSQTISTVAKDFSVRIPNHWIEMIDDKNAPNLLLWIMKEDYSASISFSPVVMDPALYKALLRDGLKSVANVSLSMKKDRVKNAFQLIVPMEKFSIQEKEFYAYEYSHDGGKTITRVVVFDSGQRFIECAMLPMKNSFTLEQIKELCATQQGVIASIVKP